MSNTNTLISKVPVASAMVLLPEDEWLSIRETLNHLVELVTKRNQEDRNAEWIESESARKILGVSPKTWQNYRDQRIIPFSQIGRKIYVNRADLEDFMRSHYIKACGI